MPVPVVWLAVQTTLAGLRWGAVEGAPIAARWVAGKAVEYNVASTANAMLTPMLVVAGVNHAVQTGLETDKRDPSTEMAAFLVRDQGLNPYDPLDAETIKDYAKMMVNPDVVNGGATMAVGGTASATAIHFLSKVPLPGPVGAFAKAAGAGYKIVAGMGVGQVASEYALTTYQADKFGGNPSSLTQAGMAVEGKVAEVGTDKVAIATLAPAAFSGFSSTLAKVAPGAELVGQMALSPAMQEASAEAVLDRAQAIYDQQLLAAEHEKVDTASLAKAQVTQPVAQPNPPAKTPPAPKSG